MANQKWDFFKKLEEIKEHDGRAVSVLTGIVFGPSYFLYRFAKYLFDPDEPIQQSMLMDVTWLYWSGNYIIPACVKKGVTNIDLDILNPGNPEERNLEFCFNIPNITDREGYAIAREVVNRIAQKNQMSVYVIREMYDISFSNEQLCVRRKAVQQA